MEKNGQIHQRTRGSLKIEELGASQPKEEKKKEEKKKPVKPVTCDKGCLVEYFNGCPEAYR
jgi:hypothetical protein